MYPENSGIEYLREHHSSIGNEDWKEQLRHCLKLPCVLVTAGNDIAGDDSLGPLIAEALSEGFALPVFQGGLAPENLLGPIIQRNPRTVLLIDAVHLGASSGSIRLLGADELCEVDFTTHAMSPRLFLEQIQSHTMADVYLLGVQPGNCDLGAPLSRECTHAASAIIRALREQFESVSRF